MKVDSVGFELRVRPSIKKDILPLFRSLRPEDLRELKVALNHRENEILDGLQRGFDSSDPCYTIHISGRPVGIYGVIPIQVKGVDVGAVWLLGTNDIVNSLNRKSQFIRESRMRLDALHARYPILWNFIDSRNHVHMRWVKWLGFNIINSVELGPERVLFHEIMRIQ